MGSVRISSSAVVSIEIATRPRSAMRSVRAASASRVVTSATRAGSIGGSATGSRAACAAGPDCA
jgi:hypothetical protein